MAEVKESARVQYAKWLANHERSHIKQIGRNANALRVRVGATRA
jgi:hypothetical protein